MRDFLMSTDVAAMNAAADRVRKSRSVIDDKLALFEKSIHSSEMKEQYVKLKTAMTNYNNVCDEIFGMSMNGNKTEATQVAFLGKGAPIAIEVTETFAKIMETRLAASKAGSDENSSLASKLTLVMILATVLGFLLAAGGGIMLARSITKPLNRVILGLGEASAQVASASGQVATSSQNLAEGSSEQAATVEETSSATEELAAMTKQNADNAHEAKTIMGDAKTVVGNVNAQMQQMVGAIGEITHSSEETSKIIKTIDEISFQTNLLALNAAVEAARAGEAGAGFAVVADEVRNLAMRAAEAAKNTSSLIEGTVKKIKEGSDLVGSTNQGFAQVAEYAAKVGTLIDEIEAASSEQAKGISQINNAVNEMNKVVQNNASSAEESASAAEEMSAQAEQMQQYVAELQGVVGGTAANGGNHHKSLSYGPQMSISNDLRQPLSPARGKSIISSSKARIVSPEKLIPMNDHFAEI
jgi:methyl-accepting chemotaxis protein